MKQFTVKVPGINFELSSNQIYHIREIADSDAPDGYQKQGITKHPLPGIAEGIIVPYNEATRTWNTGFFKGSYCYSKEAPMITGKILKQIEENLMPELDVLVDGDLRNGKSSNNRFFDEFTPFNGEGFGEDTSKYKIKGGNMFNTKHPLEFLALWFALLGKQVMPPDNKNSPSYKSCAFILEDKKQSTSLEQDKEYDKSVAMSTVMYLINNKADKKELKHLQNVFEYIGLNLTIAETETKPLISIFGRWCEKGGYNNENSAIFNQTFDKFKKEQDREELVAYVKLIKDIKSSKVKVERHDILIEGQNLGPDKKAAARKIVADQELHKAFLLI
jgi:hypothetical protein